MDRTNFCPVHNASTPCSLQAFGIRCIPQHMLYAVWSCVLYYQLKSSGSHSSIAHVTRSSPIYSYGILSTQLKSSGSHSSIAHVTRSSPIYSGVHYQLKSSGSHSSIAHITRSFPIKYSRGLQSYQLKLNH